MPFWPFFSFKNEKFSSISMWKYIPIWDTIWICGHKFVFTDSIPQKFRQIDGNFVNLPSINKIYGPRERKWILGVSLTYGKCQFHENFSSLHFYCFRVSGRRLWLANQSEAMFRSRPLNLAASMAPDWSAYRSRRTHLLSSKNKVKRVKRKSCESCNYWNIEWFTVDFDQILVI